MVDDKSMLSPTLDAVSSTKVRSRVLRGLEVVDMVGPLVAEYFERHALHDKMSGKEPWESDDKLPPVGPGGN